MQSDNQSPVSSEKIAAMRKRTCIIAKLDQSVFTVTITKTDANVQSNSRSLRPQLLECMEIRASKAG